MIELEAVNPLDVGPLGPAAVMPSAQDFYQTAVEPRGLLAREQRQRRSTVRGFTTPWPCTIWCRARPLLKQEGKLFMTPSLPNMLGLATRRAQLDCHSTCDASPKRRAPGPLISSSSAIARPHFATSNATIDPPKKALADLSTWTAGGQA